MWKPNLEIPLLDVRSPGEYAQGHVPGAISFPLFDDVERAQVGTLYKQVNPEAAFLEGLRIVGPKMADMVIQARKLAPLGRVQVHCWRGGQRSQSLAWLLRTAGMQVDVMPGGYKNYRKGVQFRFERNFNYCVLSGPTGAGKTEVLHALAKQGAQVLDLEGIASHRGSAFGSLGMESQPTIEQFENEVDRVLNGFQTDLPVWVEDESRKIGTIVLHAALWERLVQAPRVALQCEFESRVQRLVVDYGRFPSEALEQAVQRIGKRLGGLVLKHALTALHAGDLASVARWCLQYYDKAYAYNQEMHSGMQVIHTVQEAESPEKTALRLLELSIKQND